MICPWLCAPLRLTELLSRLSAPFDPPFIPLAHPLKPRPRSNHLLRRKRTYQMRIFHFLKYLNIIQLDVEELVDGFQGAFDGDVVFELDGDFVVDEGFEEAVLMMF